MIGSCSKLLAVTYCLDKFIVMHISIVQKYCLYSLIIPSQFYFSLDVKLLNLTLPVQTFHIISPPVAQKSIILLAAERFQKGTKATRS